MPTPRFSMVSRGCSPGRAFAMTTVLLHALILQHWLQGDKNRWDSLGSASLRSNFMADAVIGSLPRGLSVDERRSIAQSTPMSPALNMLSAMPSVSTYLHKLLVASLCLDVALTMPGQ